VDIIITSNVDLKNRKEGRVYYHTKLMYYSTVRTANYPVLRAADVGWFQRKGLGVVKEF
jgi:hypothetical protein